MKKIEHIDTLYIFQNTRTDFERQEQYIVELLDKVAELVDAINSIQEEKEGGK